MARSILLIFLLINHFVPRVYAQRIVISNKRNRVPSSKPFITYQVDHKGRFGDKLIMYTKAKKIAMRHGFDFLYQPFKYSDQLAMHVLENHYSQVTHRFRSSRIVKSEDEIARLNSSLCTIGFKCRMLNKNVLNKKDVRLLYEMRRVIQPLTPFLFPEHSDKYYHIALHVRDGGGYKIDTPKTKKKYIRKFPPISFYIEQLDFLAELLTDKPLHVHVFTDHTNPPQLVKVIKDSLKSCKDVCFTCRTKDNHHDANVLYDFFYMMHFDYLIRPESGFSKMVQFLGNYSLTLWPKKIEWVLGKPVVTMVGTAQHDY